MLIAGEGRLSSRIGMDAVLSLRSKGLVMPILDGSPASACYQHLKNIPLATSN
jgi:hypothetical protein